MGFLKDLLLEGVPEGIDLEEVARAMRQVPDVGDIHDLHVWAITSGNTSLTAHAVIDGPQDVQARVLARLAEVLRERFGIAHTTIQAERVSCRAAEERRGSRPLSTRKAGSLPPPPREANGYSAHGSAHLERLAFIGHCWALDVPLADVKRFSSSWRRPTRIAGAIFLACVRARLASMGALETQLSALGARCAANRRPRRCERLAVQGGGPGER